MDTINPITPVSLVIGDQRESRRRGDRRLRKDRRRGDRRRRAETRFGLEQRFGEERRRADRRDSQVPSLRKPAPPPLNEEDVFDLGEEFQPRWLDVTV